MAKRLNKKSNQEILVNSNRRKLLSLAGAASAGALLSPLLSKAAPSTIIESGSNVETASYIIFQDSGTIYAKNGTTGKMEFQGSDAKVVIENAVEAMDHGQTLFIKTGIYTPSSVINIAKAINIIGEGASHGAAPKGTRINGTGALMNITLADTRYNPSIRDILFTGGANGSCIYLSGFHGSLYNVIVSGGAIGLEGVNIWKTQFFNVQFLANGIGAKLHTSGCSSTIFFGCWFVNNKDTGLWINTGMGVGVYGSTFEGNGQYGIHVLGYEDITIDGCYFEMQPYHAGHGYTTGAHIYLDSILGARISGCSLGKLDDNNNVTDAARILITRASDVLVESCAFYQNSGEPVRKDIDNNAGSKINMTLLSCRKHHDGNWIIEGIDGIKSISTRDWLTENSGYAMTIADGGTIAHGLSSAPTKACLTGTIAGEIVTVAGLDAVNIKVAIKKPDGSSGTPQIIYWEAEV